MSATIVWFRRDLRLRDNPALAAAIKRGGAVVPIYIFDDVAEGKWRDGAASRWWLHHSLVSLDADLRARGSRLVVLRGDSAKILSALLKQQGADAVYWNRRYEPAAVSRDRALKAELVNAGYEVNDFNASLLFEPHTIKNKSGGPFQVFTPFWRHAQTLPVDPPVALPSGMIPAPKRWPASLSPAEWSLLPTVSWDEGIAARWHPGEAAAAKRLKRFVAGGIDDYGANRDRPEQDGTSAMSPHLHFGEVGPRQIWAAVRAKSADSGIFPANQGAQIFLKEIGWREFAYHLLVHFPETPDAPLRADFKRFPWVSDAVKLSAWQRSETGYPIVDAGMRQLWATGWMHNRVRMIVASFLVKHLRISWEEGAAWFWDTLVDADLANNTLGWQWSAGCGADASPYFRIFNPTLQGEKFDPEGEYVGRWIPGLGEMPAKFIHRPWEAPGDVLARAGVVLGKNYPLPIVEHVAARQAALAAIKSLRSLPLE
jgi:deoxyribodipyrimidine photo-lyase